MKKILIIGVALILAIAFIIGYFSLKKGFTLTITEEEIQKAVAEKFPIEKTLIAILNVKYSDPIVELLEGKNRVRIGITATPQMMINERAHSGSAIVNGGFRYEPSTGKFFLTDFKVESLTIDNTKKLSLDLLAIVLSTELEDVYSAFPVYTLSDTDLKQKTAKLVVKKIEVENKTIKIHFGF